MPGTEKFMADLLAIIASSEQSEDQQIDAATRLAAAYSADLKDLRDQWIGTPSGDQGLISTHNAIIAEQPAPGEIPGLAVLHAAESVIGDQDQPASVRTPTGAQVETLRELSPGALWRGRFVYRSSELG